MDPLALAIQQEVEEHTGFDKDHIFYKLIYHGIKSAHANPRSFQWPEEIVDFANSIEAQGSMKTCNFLRGPGSIVNNKQCTFWETINIPLPAKSTRQSQKTVKVNESGVMTDCLKNFIQIATV